MKLEMSLKKNVVGGLKFWKYFRTRFAGTRPLGNCRRGNCSWAVSKYFFSHIQEAATPRISVVCFTWHPHMVALGGYY